jgi:hypothetical protein
MADQPQPRYVRVVFAVTTCDRDGCEGWGCQQDEGFWTHGRWKDQRQYIYEVPPGLTVEIGDIVLTTDTTSLPTVVALGRNPDDHSGYSGPYKSITDVWAHRDLDIT